MRRRVYSFASSWCSNATGHHWLRISEDSGATLVEVLAVPLPTALFRAPFPASVASPFVAAIITNDFSAYAMRHLKSGSGAPRRKRVRHPKACFVSLCAA